MGRFSKGARETESAAARRESGEDEAASPQPLNEQRPAEPAGPPGAQPGAHRKLQAEARTVFSYAFFLAAFSLAVFLSHIRYFDLPYYWDELGQFVPAALDIFQRGSWIPERTIPNVHPPGLMAYLAGVWSVFGYSVPATRAAMLALASLSVLVVFLLAIELAKGVRGAPAFAAVVLLLASPLFFTQAMLAQLDLPAMLFTCWALLLFLQDRRRAAALACVALVLVKETGIVVPAVLGAWSLFERRRRDALWFALPVVPLTGWLLYLWRGTGHVMGNAEFTDYNLFFPLHPVRLLLALFRRAFYLGIDNFHWIGWIFVFLAWRRGMFRTRAWRIAAVLSVANVLTVTLLGGAVLERYLLPVLPVMYIAFAAAASRVALVALTAGLIASMFLPPLYQAPYENSLAMVDFVRLQQTAAQHVSRAYPGTPVTTAWPLTAALWLPELGYVEKRNPIRNIPDFRPADVNRLKPAQVELFVLFSREWDRPADPRRFVWARRLLRRVYRWTPPVTGEYIEQRFGLARVAYWTRGGQWVAVYARQEPGARSKESGASRASGGTGLNNL